MGTNSKSWPIKLKERCEAVGWTVTMTRAGHYKVRTRNGHTFVFPSSPSDRRSELNAKGEARRHGLHVVEERLKLINERDRLKRLDDDRAKANALVDAVVAAYNEDEEGSMKKEIAQQEGALGYVDGVAIAEKAPAYVKSPAPAMNGRKVQLADATELLLVDGRVLYRCERLGSWKGDIPDDQPCHATFDTPESARIHITFHSRTPDDRKAARDARRPRSVTLKRSAPKAAPKTPEVAPKPVQETVDSSSHQVGIVARVAQLVKEFERFQSELEVMSKGAEELSSELKEIAHALPDSVADETTIRNAEKYEQLRDFLR